MEEERGARPSSKGAVAAAVEVVGASADIVIDGDVLGTDIEIAPEAEDDGSVEEA